MQRYKDADPAKTVTRVRGILGDVGLCPEGEAVDHGGRLYSMELVDARTGFRTNGKGVSAGLCQASAYGEAMERLQNGFGFDGFKDEQVEAYRGFSFDPAETEASFDEALASCPHLTRDLAARFETDDQVAALHYWRLRTGDALKMVPYFQVDTGEVASLPENLIVQSCGSNGLCAGNTPAEALCEGAHELFERYAKQRILDDELCPPEIAREYVEQTCPEQSRALRFIEDAIPGARVRVLDGSLGRGLPVVCVLALVPPQGLYRVKFGSHLDFRIALERCVTELFQGFDPADPTLMDAYFTTWDRKSRKIAHAPETQMDMVAMDVGPVPDRLFASTPDWEFTPWGTEGTYSNTDGLSVLANQLVALGGTLYVRDTSFLGFPSYRIYVPGVSCARGGINGPGVDRSMRIHTALGSEISHAVAALERGELADAADYLRQTKSQRYVCAAAELDMRAEGVPTAQRDALLRTLFGEDAAHHVATRWREGDVGESLLQMHKAAAAVFTSKRRTHALQQRHDAIAAVKRTLKDRMAANPPNQSRLADLPWRLER